LNRIYKFYRWVARVSSLLVIGLILLFFIGEGIDKGFDLSTLNSRDLLLMVFFPLGMMLGFVIGWWKEFSGGLTAILSVVLFHVVYYAYTNGFPRGPWFMVFGLPGAFFLLAGMRKPRYSRPAIRFPDE